MIALTTGIVGTVARAKMFNDIACIRSQERQSVHNTRRTDGHHGSRAFRSADDRLADFWRSTVEHRKLYRKRRGYRPGLPADNRTKTDQKHTDGRNG